MLNTDLWNEGPGAGVQTPWGFDMFYPHGRSVFGGNIIICVRSTNGNMNNQNGTATDYVVHRAG